jgi:hypothetical protein
VAQATHYGAGEVPHLVGSAPAFLEQGERFVDGGGRAPDMTEKLPRIEPEGRATLGAVEISQANPADDG